MVAKGRSRGAMLRARSVADQLEHLYLAALRVVILVLATVCLIIAGFLAVDGLRRLATSTQVETQKVSVAGTDVIAEMRAKAAARQSAAAGDEPAVPPEIRQTHARFLAGPFNQYFQLYRGLALRYNKSEDEALARNALAEDLGYTTAALMERTDPTAVAFQEDPVYAAAIVAAARQVIADPAFTGMLTKYKAAQKTAQRCETKYRPERGWDSTSADCPGWYQEPVGCPVIRQVPYQDCVAVYPGNITSPLQAFGAMDANYREIWAGRTERSQAEAAAEMERLEAVKAEGMPRLGQAGTIFAGFLAVMFLFLVIAVERHLRRLAQERRPTPG